MAASWKTILVFISSTFRDMQGERDHLVRFVYPRLREELLPHRIHLIDVDLRWGVTSDQDALGVCREVIDECHPRFMCMLGGRYGWVPDGQDKSITADEIHYGVLGREAEKRGHAFFYFREERATARMLEETPGDFREPDGSDSAQKLAALKQAITNAGLPVFIYPAQWDAEQKRLTGLEAVGNKVYADLLQSIKDDPELVVRFSTEGAARPDEFAEEAEQMEAFIEERTNHFVIGSREPLMRDMLAFATADGTPNIFVLTGDPGSGKSAFLAKFCRALSQSPSLPVPQSPSLLVPHFIGASTSSTDLRRTLRHICHELARAAGNTEPLPLDIKELITHFQKLLAEAAGGRRVILVFDALDQFDATDGAHWLNWLPRELPPYVRIVASVIAPADGQPEHQTLAILRNRPGTRMKKLEPLTEADTLAVIEGCLGRYAKRLSLEQLAALLAKPAGRLPLYVLTALNELRTLGTYEEITDRIRTLPGDARALFGWILTERLARDPGIRDREGQPCGAALVGKFAAYLGVSRRGLSPSEIAALLDPGDPLGNVAALLRLLRPYLMRRGELLDFYHGQFREAAEATHLDTPEKRRAAHRSVATCLHAFADPHHDGQCHDATPHALSELPHHQTRAEVWPDLVATLTNLFFLEAKVAHGMAFDLIRDFDQSNEHLSQSHPRHSMLRLLAEALRRDIGFIDYHHDDYPQALFQCLWNSCWWYDCPQAGSYYYAPPGGWKTTPPWEYPESKGKLSTLLSSWRATKQEAQPGFSWLCAHRPPAVRLGSGQSFIFRGEPDTHHIVCSPDPLYIASGSMNGIAQIWDTESGRLNASFLAHPVAITAICYSHDGSLLATGAADGLIRIWDARTSQELAALTGHCDRVNALCFSPDRRRLTSGGCDKTVRVWNVNKATQEWISKGEEHESISSIIWSRDGALIASGSGGSQAMYSHSGDLIESGYGNKVRIWNATDGTIVGTNNRHEAPVIGVAFSEDSKEVISVGMYGVFLRWVLAKPYPEEFLQDHVVNVTNVAFTPDCRLIALGSLRGALEIRDLATGAQFSAFPSQDSISALAISCDGKRVYVGERNGVIRLWNANDSNDTMKLEDYRRVGWVALAPDGMLVATLGGHYLRIWDTLTGTQRKAFVEPTDARFVRFSDDGVYLVTTNFEDPVAAIASLAVEVRWTVWHVATGKCLNDIPEDLVFSLERSRSHFWLNGGRVSEAVIISQNANSPVAFLAETLSAQVCHPLQRLFAGIALGHLHIYTFEEGSLAGREWI